LHVRERHFALAPAFKGIGLREWDGGDGFAERPFGLATLDAFLLRHRSY
jgi:hypothetical protein